MDEQKLTALLNRIEAMCQTIGRGSYLALAREAGVARSSVHRWATYRDRTPSPDNVEKLKNWLTDKERHLDKGERALYTAYKSAIEMKRNQ